MGRKKRKVDVGAVRVPSTLFPVLVSLRFPTTPLYYPITMYIETTTTVEIDRWKHETTTAARAFTVNDVVTATMLEYNTVVETLEALVEIGCITVKIYGDRVPRVYTCNKWIDMWTGSRSTAPPVVLTGAASFTSWVESATLINRAT